MGRAVDKKVLKALLGLASMVELCDPYTGGHLWRVGQFSKLLAAKIGMEADDVFLAAVGGFLHDLGKVGVPDAILRKPDRLTDEEFAIIKAHPVMGGELLVDHPLAELARDAVLHHHERPDGQGYPAGLIAEQCPLVARIVGITDAFDAMTSTRSYRRGMPVEKALSILAEESGHQFDAGLTEAFISLHRVDGALAHVMGHSDHGQKLLTCPGCGPIIAVSRTAVEGSETLCRNCGTLFRLNRRGDGWVPEPIGVAADLGVLRPYPETEVLDEFADAAPRPRSSFFVGRISALMGIGAD